MTCKHCGGNDVVQADSVNVVCPGGGTVQINFQKKKSGWFVFNSERVQADVCRDCGTVRFYVKNT
jgi:hypothetical protein